MPQYQTSSPKFSSHPLPLSTKGAEADGTVLTMIEHCAEIVRAAAPESALYLWGSFGRGEGTVTQIEGHWRPLKDFDLLLIGQPNASLQEIESRMNTMLADRWAPIPDGFRATLQITSPLVLRHLADITTADIKYGAHRLSGPDLRPKMRVTAQDVPYSSGYRLLLQKYYGLLLARANIEGNLAYEINKTYVEILTAFSILHNAYQPSYRKRAADMGEWISSTSAEFQQRLAPKLLRASERKLTGGPFPLNPEAYDEVLADLRSAECEYLRVAWQIQSEDWNEDERRVRPHYYRPYARFALQGIALGWLAPLAAEGYKLMTARTWKRRTGVRLGKRNVSLALFLLARDVLLDRVQTGDASSSLGLQGDASDACTLEAWRNAHTGFP